MTIREAIDEVTSTRPHGFDEGWIIRWLSRCEALIDKDIIRRYQCAGEPFAGFPADVDTTTELAVPEPNDSLYIFWLEAQINYANGDIDRFNNSISMFNAEMESFRRNYARCHRPQKRLRFRF